MTQSQALAFLNLLLHPAYWFDYRSYRFENDWRKLSDSDKIECINDANILFQHINRTNQRFLINDLVMTKCFKMLTHDQKVLILHRFQKLSDLLNQFGIPLHEFMSLDDSVKIPLICTERYDNSAKFLTSNSRRWNFFINMPLKRQNQFINSFYWIDLLCKQTYISVDEYLCFSDYERNDYFQKYGTCLELRDSMQMSAKEFLELDSELQAFLSREDLTLRELLNAQCLSRDEILRLQPQERMAIRKFSHFTTHRLFPWLGSAAKLLFQSQPEIQALIINNCTRVIQLIMENRVTPYKLVTLPPTDLREVLRNPYSTTSFELLANGSLTKSARPR